MSTRDLIKTEIDILPDDIINSIYDYVFFLKHQQHRVIQSAKTLTEAQEAFQRLEKYRGTLKRDVDIKKERLEYLDEKYNNLS